MPGLARGSLSPSPTAPELTRASHFHIALLQLPLLPLSSTFKFFIFFLYTPGCPRHPAFGAQPISARSDIP